MKELYKRLHLKSDKVDQETIKKAYKRTVMSCHPDRHPDKAEEFKKVQEAWEVLGDPDRRAAYDETGEIPSGKADNEDKEFAEMIGDAMRVAVATAMEQKQKLRRIDMVRCIDAHFLDSIAKGQQNIKYSQELIEQLKTTLGRYKNKKKENNLLEDLTRNQIKIIEVNIEGIQEGINKIMRCRELLREYEFDVEKAGYGYDRTEFEERTRRYREMFDMPKLLGGS